LTESSDIPSRLVHFCSFLRARFIVSTTFHPTSSSGLFFTDRKEESRMPDLGVMRRCLLVFLGIMAALTTGCPRNEYVVEMKPLGVKLERKLTVWREDGKETNGEPNYGELPEAER